MACEWRRARQSKQALPHAHSREPVARTVTLELLTYTSAGEISEYLLSRRWSGVPVRPGWPPDRGPESWARRRQHINN